MLTKEEVVAVMPVTLRGSVTQGLVDTINNVTSDPLIAQQVRDNFISYTSVLKDGKFKTEDYLNAVTYVSYKLMNMTNVEAYAKTFPQRYAALVAKGTVPKDIAAYVSAYHKGKLVNLILEQTLVPSWVLNQDLYQKAINTQAQIMQDPNVSAKVRSDAADSLLTHLAKPKEAGPLVSIDMRETSGISELKGMLAEMAQQQQNLISNGVSTQSVAAQRIFKGEVIDNGTN